MIKDQSIVKGKSNKNDFLFNDWCKKLKQKEKSQKIWDWEKLY